MRIYSDIPLIDDVLDAWSGVIRHDIAGYRNHVYRMVNFTYAMDDFDQETQRKIVIAGCFHDIGIWPDRTLDLSGAVGGEGGKIPGGERVRPVAASDPRNDLPASQIEKL